MLQTEFINSKAVNFPRQIRQHCTRLTVGGRFHNARHGDGQLKEVLDGLIETERLVQMRNPNENRVDEQIKNGDLVLFYGVCLQEGWE